MSAELAKQRTERDQAIAPHLVPYRGPIGLLGREEALAHLASERPAIGATSWIFRLFLLAMDIVPILVKTLLLLGKESDIERLNRELGEHERNRVDATEDAHDAAHRIAAQRLVTEEQRVSRAFETRLDDAVKQLVDIQMRLWQQQIGDFEDAVEAARRKPRQQPGLPHAMSPRNGSRKPTGP